MRTLLMVAMLALACARPEPAKPLDAWRQELADPEKYSLRQEGSVDFVRFTRAFDRARAQHREALGRAFTASIEALPSGPMPSPARYEVRLKYESDEADIRRAQAFTAALEADAAVTARFFISQFLPIAMIDTLGTTTADLGVWLGFFYAARPTVTVCGKSVQELSICVDYGGADILVVDMVPDDELWVGHRMTWWTLTENS
ncbi:MAG: hypothetical protein AAFU77_10455 [Myxococcota bacterium]